MAFTNAEKLTIFHDIFIENSWRYISRQKEMELGLEVPVMTTSFKEKLSLFRMLPVAGSVADATFLITDLWNGRLSSPITASINKLFPSSDIMIKRMLSNAIHEVVVHIEPHLSQLQDSKEVTVFALEGVMKLISFLKTQSINTLELSCADIVNSVLAQNNYFTNDRFLARSILDVRARRADISTEVDSLIIYSLKEISNKHEEVIKRVKQNWAEERNILERQNLVSFYNVRDAVHNFVGREEIFVQIENCFTEGESVIEIIGGLGGMGKTQAALQYIKEHKAEYNYRVRWFDAESESSLYLSFRKFAEKLNLSTNGKTDEEIVDLVKEKLESEIDQTLLVFDNVNNRDIVNRFLPNLGGAKKHHVLITTRNIRDYDKHSVHSGERVITLNPFSEEEALLYIQTILRNSDVIYTEEEAIELAKLFNNIPLGLSQSVAYIKNNLDSIQEYIAEYLKIKKQEIPIKLHDAEIEEEAGHVENIYTTLMISLKALFSIPKAVEMIKICSFLYADAIPEYIFDSLFETTKEKKDAIAILTGYSLISVKLEKSVKLIYVHRIVQEVTRFIAEDKSLQYLQQAMELVHNQMEDTTELWNEFAIIQKNSVLLKHALELIEHSKSYLPDFNIISKNNLEELSPQIRFLSLLYRDNGDFYLVNYNYSIALKYLKQSLLLGKIVYDYISPEIATTISRIGNAYLYSSLYTEALNYYEESLRIKRIFYKDGHITIANTIHNIGCVYKNLGQCKKALNYFEQALALRKEKYGDDHSEVAVTILNISDLYDDLGNTKEALRLCDQSYVDLKKRYGDMHPTVALISRKIGNFYKNLQLYKKALEKYEEALYIYKKIYITYDQVSIAAVLNEIADIHNLCENYDQSLSKHEEALHIIRTLGDKNIEVAKTIIGIAKVYLKQKQYQFYILKYKEALMIYRENSGDKNHEFGQILGRFGNDLTNHLRRYGDAFAIYEEAFYVIKLTSGYWSRDIGGIIANQGNIYKILGKSHDALNKYKEALEIFQKVLYDKDPLIIHALTNIGDIYVSLKRIDEGIEYYIKGLEIQRSVFGDDSKDVLQTLRAIFYARGLLNKKSVTKKEVATADNSAEGKKTLSYQDNRLLYENKNLLLMSLTIKESIEAAPIIKYFFEEILYLPLPELPEIMYNNYLWFGAHYLVCNVGVYLISNKFDFIAALTPNLYYVNKILVYEYLSELRQNRFKETEDKSIKSPIEFIEKCGPDMLSQVSLVVMNNEMSIAPIIYDVSIGVAVGGMQCYQQYKQSGNVIKEQSITQILIPYAVDTLVGGSIGYALFKHNPLDTTTIFGKMIAIKEVFVVISSVVISDYMTKLFLTTCEGLISEEITGLVGETYKYFTGEYSDPEL